jgi:hypothetical protein
MTARLSKSALFEGIGYEPHAGQLLVHRSNATRRVLSCGSRWGKTTCASGELVAALFQPRREALGWVVAPTYDLARLAFERTVRVIERKFRHRIKSLSLRQQTLTVINLAGGRSTLESKSADNPSSLLGESLDFVVLDEAAVLKQEIWEQHVSQRLVDRRGWALFISTPAGRNWFARLHRRGQRGRDADFESWTAPSWDNPTLDRALIEAERGRLGDDAFRAQYGGEFIGLDLEPCDRCGGPSPRVPAMAILNWGEVHPRCPECGLQVNKDGRTIVHRFPNGRAGLMTIVLDGRPRPLASPLELSAADLQVRAD